MSAPPCTSAVFFFFFFFFFFFVVSKGNYSCDFLFASSEEFQNWGILFKEMNFSFPL